MGREFRGRNLHRLAPLLGLEEFRKGFFRARSSGRVFGYNRLPSAPRFGRLPAALLRGRPFLFFEVVPASELRAPAHEDALVIRYAGWPDRGRLDPLRLVVDYLVRPARRDRTEAEVLLGKSYLEWSGRRLFLEHFRLETPVETALSGGAVALRP